VSDVYSPLALSVLQGAGYVLAGDARDESRVPPAFPLYLAAVYRVFGTDVRPFILSILNSVFRALTTLLVYLLAGALLDSRAAVAAGLIHAVDPWEVLWAVVVLKDSVTLVLFMAAVVAVSQIPRAPVVM